MDEELRAKAEETAPKRVMCKTIPRDATEPSESRQAVTPSRRSVRIHSYTNLMAASQLVLLDTPRARRALRRNSTLEPERVRSKSEEIQPNISSLATSQRELLVSPRAKRAARRNSPLEPERVSSKSEEIQPNISSLAASQRELLVSPRAKRAARRNSPLGNTESVTTPARPTRRTIKDSISIVENHAVANSSKKTTVQAVEAITKEPEKEISKDTNLNKTDGQSPVLRSSPRFNKKGIKSIKDELNIMREKPVQQNKILAGSANLGETSPSNGPAQGPSTNTDDHTASNVELNISKKKITSLNSANLINKTNTNAKKSLVFNKTASTIEESKTEITSRRRTKTWTISQPIQEVNLFDKIYNKNSEKRYKSTPVFNISIENEENMHCLESVNDLDAKDTVNVLKKTLRQVIPPLVFVEDFDSGNIWKLM